MTSAKPPSSWVSFEDDLEAIYDNYCDRGWTDGLPFIPPTAERVERMIAASGREPGEEVAEIPPRQARASIEKLAVNAVMAGCKPAYFPVLLAMVEAVVESEFSLYAGQCTTNPATELTVVNGPIRNALDINSSYGCFGPGRRANATIGRALRLVLRNIGGALPGDVSKSTHGQPGRYTMCIGEFEERSPWEPLHVERGFGPEESTVTVFAITELTSLCETMTTSAEGILTVIAHSIDGIGTNHMFYKHLEWEGESLLILCPDHAAVIARDGWSKADIKAFLYTETKAIPLSRWPEELRRVMPVTPGRAHDGAVSLHHRPEDFVVIVAGGPGGYHSCWCPTHSHSRSVTKRIHWPGSPRP